MEAVQYNEQERNDAVKNVLFETFCQQYQSLNGMLNKLPINQQLKAIIMQYFDTGFLWAKEGFAAMTLTIPQVPPKPLEVVDIADAKTEDGKPLADLLKTE
jgi:hypothetical protein